MPVCVGAVVGVISVVSMPLAEFGRFRWECRGCPERVASSREVVVCCSDATLHVYVMLSTWSHDWKVMPTVPSGPLPLATSASPEHKKTKQMKRVKKQAKTKQKTKM